MVKEIVYDIMFDLPDMGLMPLGDGPEPEEPPPSADDHTPPSTPCWYPTQTRRSVVGNQPYDAYAPRMQFLQLREVRAHRNALAASKEREMNLAEATTKAQMHATTGCMELDDVEHQSNKELTMSDKHYSGVVLPDDPIQSETRASKIWGKRRASSHV